MGSAAQPGAAVFPLLIGAAFAVVSVLTLIEALRSEPGTPAGLPYGAARRRLLLLAAALLGAILAMPLLGAFVVLAAFIAFALWLLGDAPWKRAIPYATAIAGLVYLTFVLLLKVPLPNGIFD